MSTSSTARTFLVPVDDSEGSTKAVKWTLEQLARPDDELHLLHVVPIPVPEVVGGIGVGGAGDFVLQPPDPAVDRKNIEKAEEFITKRFTPLLSESKQPHKIEIVHFSTDADSVGEVVAARAEKLNAEAVVLAKHNKGAIKELLLGSTAKHLTKHCKRPVVVLHG